MGCLWRNSLGSTGLDFGGKHLNIWTGNRIFCMVFCTPTSLTIRLWERVGFNRLERASRQWFLSQLWPWFWDLALNELAAVDCMMSHLFFTCSRLSVKTLFFSFKDILNKGNILVTTSSFDGDETQVFFIQKRHSVCWTSSHINKVLVY